LVLAQKIVNLTLILVPNDQDAVKIMAKDLVRTRKYVKKFMLMKTNIQAVSLRIQVWSMYYNCIANSGV
jgi:charged multivesicular body protein 2A